MITKKTTDFNFDFLNGEVILIDKPEGWTSFKAVHKIRKAVEVRKVGHAGTLDPMATGLLIMCTGKKTKVISEYQNLPKTYEGIITLGKTSPSMDLETEATNEKSTKNITEEQIIEAKKSFTGKIKQTPPMFSAVKINGKRLYELARKGKEVKREPREIEIYIFEILKIELPEIWFKIECSRGTYIRVIANDLGEKLGCGGLLSKLRRTAIGDFSVADAFTPNEFKEMLAVSRENV
jgi:tRNA pseudouridine55 synthase